MDTIRGMQKVKTLGRRAETARGVNVQKKDRFPLWGEEERR